MTFEEGNMNLGKALITGVIGGIVVCAYNFLMHGVIMANAYTKYAVFRQEQASPIWFFVVSIALAIAGALLFAKSRSSWAAGIKGGLVCGFFLGLISFFAQFFNPLIFQDFPYHMSWCWGGITLIGWLVFGAVAGVLYKKEA